MQKSLADNGTSTSVANRPVASSSKFADVLRPAILRPFIPEEAMRAREAAKYAGVHPATIGIWSKRHNIGRVISRDLYVSRVALQALLEDDKDILTAYLAGDRESAPIQRLYTRLGIPLPSAQSIGE